VVNEKMMAAVLYGREDVRVEQVTVPEVGAGDVLVRVRAALTCGTDLKVFRRGYHAKMIVPPALFGHELAGDIVAVGEGVHGFRPGDRVVAANSAPCMRCFFCRKGQQSLCEDLLFNNGAYAEYIRIPSRIVRYNLYHLPDHLDYKDAALLEPLACVVKGLDDTPLQPGDNVVVLGQGPIGMMFTRLARVYGARVIAVARRQERLDMAARMGAHDGVLNGGTNDAVAQIKKLTGGYGADIVIEAVGKPETWELAVRMLRRGGTVNFFGGCPADTRVSLDTGLLHYSELKCIASFHHTPAIIKKSLEIISRGEISAQDFVNQEEPLTELNSVLRHLMSHNGHLKTAIIP
jgi:L-iditol 2-dehydrogenase